jgi:hypothetical protein
MRVEDLHIEIRRLLAQFSLEVKGASAAGNIDISDEADMLLLELFRETFDLPNLRSLNADQANFPGLDLADDVAGRAFQITAEKDLNKILKTLRTTISRNLHAEYPKIQVYVTTERQTRYKQATIDAATGGAVTFRVSRVNQRHGNLSAHRKGFKIVHIWKYRFQRCCGGGIVWCALRASRPS